MITAQDNRPQIQYQEWPRNSGNGDNLGRSLWTRIMAKAVPASTLPCSHVSTVDLMLLVARLCCSLFDRLRNDYRAFVRPYPRNQFEGNIFVRHHCSVGYERYIGIYRSRESCPCGSQTRATMAGLVPELLWRQWESTILFQVNPTQLSVSKLRRMLESRSKSRRSIQCRAISLNGCEQGLH